MDAAFIGMLTAFGASSNDALAADMVWRRAPTASDLTLGLLLLLLAGEGLVGQ